MLTGLPVIDLFAGAGGLGMGVLQAGGDLRLSVELDPIACETLDTNETFQTGHVLCEDVANLTGPILREFAGLASDDSLVIVGGPPCQPFSKAAYWTDPGDDSRYRRARARGEWAKKPSAITTPRPDERRDLLAEFRRLVVESDADGFLFENVPSIMHPRNRMTFQKFVESFQEEGFVTSLATVNAAEYGVPQRRKRVVVIGCKAGEVGIAKPSHHLDSNIDGYLLPAQTAGEALAKYSGAEYSEPEEVVTGRWAEHLRTVPPGMNYKAHTAWAGHPHPAFVTETRFWHFLLKLHPDQSSWTIAASPGPWTGPFHWESRRLRTPELAALQGFPPDYHFCGTRRERVRQIGNAMPAPLASALLAPLLEALVAVPVA